ncbi:Transcriptional activator spt7 [Tieghemiomyces parasiticus]|uniref:Transcriptional activator spt7 n=1 Tax=Tieghemiomyces parasiticus TaxID=78921 RepID=A0A9W8DTY2_9FUNG|nr:Transcriptional activator spt7 [Tieghemiomyces parasiticus]
MPDHSDPAPVDQRWAHWEYYVAEQLKDARIYQAHLHPREYQPFLAAIDGPDQLNKFLRPTDDDAPCTCHTADGTQLPNGTARVYARFRARAMIFEQIIPSLYPSACGCSVAAVVPLVPSSLSKTSSTSPCAPSPPVPSIPSFSLGDGTRGRRPGADLDEDDYDNDDDDDYDAVENTSHVVGTQPFPVLATATPASLTMSPAEPVADGDASADEGNPPAYQLNTEEFRIPVNDAFYTLEEDETAAAELVLVEAAREAQRPALGMCADMDDPRPEGDPGPLSALTDKSGPLGSPTDVFHDSMIANVSRNNPHLKHLFHVIDSQRQNLPVSDRELRHLLTDLRTHRSKWASDERVGQEELYEALEKTLQELKNYGEHAQPFLAKVSRRDAPDYYDVIIEPMDLGAMTKKLKNLQYQSRAEFIEDLDLIYKNCFQYNSDPESTYRRHATYLRRKAEALLKHVPDITIRDRAHVEAAEEDTTSQMDLDTERHYGSDSERSVNHTPRLNGSTSFGGGPAVDVSTPGSFTAGSRSVLGDLHGEGSQPGTPSNLRRNTATSTTGSHDHEGPLGTAQEPELTTVTEGVGGGYEEEGEEEEESAVERLHKAAATIPDMRTLGWHYTTDRYRGQQARELDRMATKPFTDHVSVLRTAAGMGQFTTHAHVRYEAVRWADGQLVRTTPGPALSPADRGGGSGGALALMHATAGVALPTTRMDTLDSTVPTRSMQRFNRANLQCHTGRPAAVVQEHSDSDHDHHGPALTASEASGLPLADFVPEYEPAAGISELRPGPADPTLPLSFRPSASNTALDAFDGAPPSPPVDIPIERYPSALIPTGSTLPYKLFSNIHLIREVRAVDSKIWSTRLNAPLGAPVLDEAAEVRASATAAGADPVLADLSRRAGFLVDSPVRPAPVTAGPRLDHMPWGAPPPLPAAGPSLPGHSVPPPRAAAATTTAFPTRGDADDDDSTPLPPLELDAKTAYHLMTRVTTVLATHTGYEDLHVTAVSVLTDLAIESLMNMGRTLRLYCDRFARRMDAHEMLRHTLQENGLDSMRELETYLRDDFDRFRPKLTDLKRKLENAYLRVLDQESEDEDSEGDGEEGETYYSDYSSEGERQQQPSVGGGGSGRVPTGGAHGTDPAHRALQRPRLEQTDPNLPPGTEGELDFDANKQAFIVGDFGGSLGTEDFLGFKELGLDEEYGMDSLKLPNQLMFGTEYRSPDLVVRKKRKRRRNVLPYRPPREPFPSVTIENMHQQIGLMAEVFHKKAASEPEGGIIVEDEALPPRQRYNAFKPKTPAFIKPPLVALKLVIPPPVRMKGNSNKARASKAAAANTPAKAS